MPEARPAVRGLAASKIREIANAGMESKGRGKSSKSDDGEE